MKRSRSNEHDVVKQTILEVAAQLFSVKGFASTSMNEIADGANISKAGIYHYFESKVEILCVMLIEHLSVVSEIADESFGSSEDPRTKFHTFTQLLIESYTRSTSKHHHVILMRDIDSLPPKDREFIVKAERRIIRSVERLLQTIYPELLERPYLTRPLVMLFFGMINWTDNWYSEQGWLSPEELATLATKLFLEGVKSAIVISTPEFSSFEF